MGHFYSRIGGRSNSSNWEVSLIAVDILRSVLLALAFFGMLHRLFGMLLPFGQSVALRQDLIPLKVVISRYYLTDKKQ